MPARWEDPPEPQKGPNTSSKQQRIVNQLRNNPGRWAVIHTAPNTQAAWSYASWRKQGKSPAWTPVSDFEITCRGSKVYARYVGEGK